SCSSVDRSGSVLCPRWSSIRGRWPVFQADSKRSHASSTRVMIDNARLVSSGSGILRMTVPLQEDSTLRRKTQHAFREELKEVPVVRSGRDLFCPKLSDRAQLSLDRLRDAPELRSDLAVGVSFQLPQRHRAQRVVTQAVAKQPAFLPHLGGEL